MALDLADFETKAADSVKAFWGNRAKAKQKQIETGTIDQGERGSVTAGANLNGFVSLIKDLVKANGLGHADIHIKSSVVTLPGFFRPTKRWDLLVIHNGRLIAAIELKSQGGSDLGKNYNNRTEEAIGSGHDLQTAFREKAFGDNPVPFIGWIMLVEDTDKSNVPVKDKSPHFKVFPEFEGASYLKRYELLCERLVREKLYTAAAVITTRRDAIDTGAYKELSELTGLRNFVSVFAGHIAIEAAR